LSLTVTNRGNLLLQDVQVSLALPESMSIDNAAASQHIGYMGVGETKTVKFPVFVNKKTENKNYQIAAKMTALNKGAPASFERTFYVPVFGGEEEKEIKASDISVTGIILPAEVKAGEEFTMDFRIENNGESKLEDVKIDVAPEAGVVNKTKNVFVEPVLEPGASKAYSVTFFSDEKAEQKSYPIKITVTAGTGEKPAAVSQYGSVFLRKTDAVSNIKTPKLIVDNYNYGGGSIRAGDSFGLSLSLYNTSEKNIRNIKVTVTAETGAIVPSGGSNAFFIDNIPSKDRVSKNLTMAASPTAEQKTTSLTVTMAYEDGSGNEFTSADVIAIPVIQKTSLTVDDVMSNGSGIYVGTQTSLSVRFYNTGKTQLRNLRILAEGNFEPVDVASYYAGNMESGASDSYEFAFVPTEEGALEGSVIFTFEDPSGNGQRQEQGFSFPVSEQMEEPDMGLDMPIQPESPFGGKLPYIIGGAAVAVILAALLLRRFLKRWKLDREMEIDE
ncbi:MAG: hypothetical protein LBT26_04930, partial [Clostridiales Family XIII bacterium]|nr:hypothetical protein [Clostridiales Family XIII bacterium]